MRFKIYDKVKDVWWDGGRDREITDSEPREGDYNIDIYIDGSFSVTEFKNLDDVGMRWVCRDSDDFELYIDFQLLKIS